LVVAHPMQIRQTNMTVDLKMGGKRQDNVEKKDVRLLAVFISIIPFYYGLGSKNSYLSKHRFQQFSAEWVI